MRQLQNQSGPANPWPVPVLNTTPLPSNPTKEEIELAQIPPHGVMQISGSTQVGEDTVYFVTKPNGAENAKFLINSPSSIPQSGYGFGTDFYPTTAAFNGFTGTPFFGSEWGPVAGSWLLSGSGKGFLLLGGTLLGDPSLSYYHHPKQDGTTESQSVCLRHRPATAAAYSVCDSACF
jgi:hypothetical protein